MKLGKMMEDLHILNNSTKRKAFLLEREAQSCDAKCIYLLLDRLCS